MSGPPGVFVALFALVVVVALILLGVQLRLAYLGDVMRRPRALVVGLAGQLLLLPALAWGFFAAYPAPAGVKAAAFIIAAVPGGAISNMVTFWGRGRLSLSVVLTAGSTVAGVVTIPLWVNVGLSMSGGGEASGLPVVPMAARSFAILVVPLAIGIGVGAWKPSLAQRMEGPTRRAMLFLVAGVMVLYLAMRWQFVAAAFTPHVFVGALALSASAVLGGWGLGRSAGLDRPDSFTVGIEVGIQNVVMALLVVELLGRPEFLPFVGFYALISLLLIPFWVRLLPGM
jgi:BASS family bile acid:Na+ symporter